MRSLILTLTLVLFALGAEAQNSFEANNKIIKTFFEKYQNRENITNIKVGAGMTKIMALTLFESGDDSSAQLLRSIKSIDILVEESDNDSTSLIRNTMFALPELCDDFELITSINSSGELSNFYFALHDKGEPCEFLMLVKQADQAVVLYITGDFSVSDISALSAIGSGVGAQQ